MADKVIHMSTDNISGHIQCLIIWLTKTARQENHFLIVYAGESVVTTNWQLVSCNLTNCETHKTVLDGTNTAYTGYVVCI